MRTTAIRENQVWLGNTTRWVLRIIAGRVFYSSMSGGGTRHCKTRSFAAWCRRTDAFVANDDGEPRLEPDA